MEEIAKTSIKTIDKSVGSGGKREEMNDGRGVNPPKKSLAARNS